MKMKTATFFLVVVFVLPATLASQHNRIGQAKGRLTKDGLGTEGMIAFFHEESGPSPRPDRYFRIPDEVVYTDPDGWFTVELAVGNYYIGAIKRKAGRRLGPPGKKDVVYLKLGSSSRQGLFAVKEDETLNIGIIGDQEIFKPTSGKTPSITKIEGTILGPDNRPVKGMYVVGFRAKFSQTKPQFVSLKTGRNGKYSLRVKEQGQYFIRTRSVLGGGPPQTGSFAGVYGGQDPAPVTVETGCTKKDIDIRVETFQGPGQPDTSSR